jgi:hypothetical protein
MGYLRLRSPLFALALILSFLPWVEIRCNHPEMGEIRIAQSGVQAVYGGHSITVNGKTPTDTQKMSRQVLPNQGQGANQQLSAAPLMVLFLASLGAGLAAGLAVPNAQRRWLICAIALGVLVIQTMIGFPLTAKIPRGDGGWNYTLWFWLTVASTFGTVVLSLMERGTSGSQSRTGGRTDSLKAKVSVAPRSDSYSPPS